LTDSLGAPVNLAGAALKMRLDVVPGLASAADPASATGLHSLDLSTGNGRIVLADAALGQFEIALPAAVLRTLSPGVYDHDLVLSLAGRAQRVWDGTLTLNAGVTP
jgi:hypothetical protein